MHRTRSVVMNSIPSQIIALARQWLPDVAPQRPFEPRNEGSIPIELEATVQLARRVEDELAYASISGEINFGPPRMYVLDVPNGDDGAHDGSRRARCTARRPRERLLARCPT